MDKNSEAAKKKNISRCMKRKNIKMMAYRTKLYKPRRSRLRPLALLTSFIFTISLYAQVDITLLRQHDPGTGQAVNWELCNKDSDLFKKDTLNLSTIGNTCCKIVRLETVNEKVKDIYEINTCKGTTSYSLEDRLKVTTIESKGGNYYLNFYDDRGLWMSFNIVMLRKSYTFKDKKKMEYFQMTLVRSK
jgi:hypothetical protein